MADIIFLLFYIYGLDAEPCDKIVDTSKDTNRQLIKGSFFFFFFFFEKDQRKLIRLAYEELYHGLDLIKQVNHGKQKNQIP